MTGLHSCKLPLPLPELFLAVPLWESEARATLKTCLLLWRNPEAGESPLRVLRRVSRGKVVWGALVDSANFVHEWLEIWVHDVADETDAAGFEEKGSFNSLVALEAWEESLRKLRKVAPHDFLSLPVEAESVADRAIIVDLERKESLALTICKDDALLEQNGLPRYSTTQHRYVDAGNIGTPVLAPLSPGAPDAENGLKEACGVASAVVLNPWGGIIAIQVLRPLQIDECSDLISGRRCEGITIDARDFREGSMLSAFSADGGVLEEVSGSRYLTPPGGQFRLPELLFLKLNLLSQACRSVQAFSRTGGAPLFNISNESFRVAVGKVGEKLPLFWGSDVALGIPGDAVQLKLPAGEGAFFTSVRDYASPYRANAVPQRKTGKAQIRIRRCEPTERDRVIIEATLLADDDLGSKAGDLLFLQMDGPGGRRVRLAAYPDTMEALGPSEYRLRSLPVVLEGVRSAEWNEFEGRSLHGVPYQLIPAMTAALDMYSLGVVGVRLLLVDQGNSLAIALDELMSFGRAVSEAVGNGESYERALVRLADDERWMASLGPHRLVWAEHDPIAAAACLPAGLWGEVLGWLLRWVPGLVPSSYCRDYRTLPCETVAGVYDGPLQKLEILLEQTRGLLFSNWRSNEEMHRLLAEFA